jgi:hypothetical protein
VLGGLLYITVLSELPCDLSDQCSCAFPEPRQVRWAGLAVGSFQAVEDASAQASALDFEWAES